MKLALDPYMFRRRRCSSCPLSWPTSATSGSSCRRATTSSRSSTTRASTTARRRRLPQGAGGGGCRRLVGAAALPVVRARTRTTGRRRCATGSAPSRSPSRLGVDTMNSEFNGNPREAATLRADVLALDGGAAAGLRAGGHPARARAAPRRLGGGRQARRRPDQGHQQPATCRFLYCAPHTFHQGNDCDGIMEQGRRPADDGPRRRLLRPHRARPGCATSSTRPARRSRVHQHLDIGQGEVDFDAVLQRPRAHRLRRHRHLVRLRVGGPRPRVEHRTCATRSAPTSTSGPPRPRSSHPDPARPPGIPLNRLCKRRKPS